MVVVGGGGGRGSGQCLWGQKFRTFSECVAKVVAAAAAAAVAVIIASSSLLLLLLLLLFLHKGLCKLVCSSSCPPG